MSIAENEAKIEDLRREAFPNPDDLVCFLRAMGSYERKVLKDMMESDDWTVRLETRGNRNGLVHCRVDESDIARPPLSEKRVADAKKPKKIKR